MRIQFLGYELDPATRELHESGRRVDVQPLVFELLLYLISNRDRVVPKDELLDSLWADAEVTEASLLRAVSLARRAIADGDRSDPAIRNYPRVGYRFTAEVEERPDATPRTGLVRGRGVPARSGYAEAGGTHIAYQVVGDGPVDLVLVHGWMLSVASIWEDEPTAAFHRELASRARLILFDKRGTGLSDRVKDLPGLSQRMEDLTAVLDAVESRRAFVFGVSEGAPMSLLYAATHPERVAGLALMGGFARMTQDEEQPFGWTPDDIDRLDAYIRTRWGEGSSIAASISSRSNEPGFREWVARSEQIGGSPGAAIELWDMNRTIDVRDVLPVLETPCLIMHASDDPVIDVEHGRQLSRAIEGARYVEVESSDHLLFAPAVAGPVLSEIAVWLEAPPAEPVVRRRLGTLMLCAAEGGQHPGESELIDQLLMAHAGRQVQVGEPVLSVIFDGPATAARCARALVRGARRQGAELRVALHCGEFECTDPSIPSETDAPEADATRPHAAGPGVGVAADLLREAAEGEVLATSIVKELSMGSGLDFEPRESRPGAASPPVSVYVVR